MTCPECNSETTEEEYGRTVATSDGESDEQYDTGEFCTNVDCFHSDNPI
jgi:hypothetical protein